jgi:hypothetical protein
MPYLNGMRVRMFSTRNSKPRTRISGILFIGGWGSNGVEEELDRIPARLVM